MVLFILFLVFILCAAFYVGFKPLVRIDQLTYDRVVNSILAVFALLTLMSIAHWLGIISQPAAAKVTMGAYTFAGGFFLGYGAQLIQLRSRAGELDYMYRSFWTDIAPNLIFVALFVFGIYRTGLLHWDYFTGIGITSGLSLIGFGFMGWTLRIVPEFRIDGILMLDQFIEWKKIVSYQWDTEETLQIDYLTDTSKISDFKTFIPSEDQLIIERLLGKKLKEHEEERRKIMSAQQQQQPGNQLNS